MVKWYSLFSHTGRETEAMQKGLSDYMSLEAAITTNSAYDGPLPYVKLISHKYVNEWLMSPGNIQPGSLITLNGYMGILPADVLEYLYSVGCKVYNIHPAPIQLYPDLKGKDPQERLYEGIQTGKYTMMGSVIHEVDAGVDTGDIKHWRTVIADPGMTKEELYEYLHDQALKMWLEFIPEVIKLGQNRKADST